MRVLHVLSSLDQAYGGPVRLVMDLSARCLALGLDSEVLGFGEANLPDNPFPKEKIHALPVGFPRSYVYSPKLRDWIQTNLGQFDAAVIHGAWTYPGWAVAAACRSIGLPYGAFPHGMLEPWTVSGQGVVKAWKKHAYWAWRERYTFQKARCVFFTTERERTLANRLFRFPTQQAVLCPYGIPSSSPPVVRPQSSTLEPLFEMQFALFLGRVHPKKNVDFLLRAWAAAQVPESWRLVIAGPGDESYLRWLGSLANRLSIDRQVAFLGFVAGHDKTFLLQRARWFLLPSKQENFGVAVLEAISHGCPVALSDQVYLSEAFREDSEVLPLVADCWVEFLRERMMNPEWRGAVLRKDREHLQARFDMERVARDWAIGLQRELVGTVQRGRRCLPSGPVK